MIFIKRKNLNLNQAFLFLLNDYWKSGDGKFISIRLNALSVINPSALHGVSSLPNPL